MESNIRVNLEKTENEALSIRMAKDVQAGVFPSNADLEEAMQKPLDSLRKQQIQETDPKAKAIASDVESLLLSTRRFLSEKNKNEVFQEFIRHCKLASEDLSPKMRELAMKGTKEAEKEASSFDFGEGLKSIFYQMSTDNEFRRLLMETLNILSEIVGQNIQKKEEHEKEPTEEEDLTKEVDLLHLEFSPQKKEEKEVVLSKEQTQELAKRLSAVFLKVASHEEMKHAVRALHNLAGVFKSEMQDSTWINNPNIQKAKIDLRILLENLAGGYMLTNLEKKFDQVQNLREENNEFNTYMNEVEGFIREMDRMDKNKMESNEQQEKLTSLIMKGQDLLSKNDNIKDKVNKFLNEVRRFLSAIENDPTNRRLIEDMSKVMNEMTTTDATGEKKLSMEGMEKLGVLLSNLLKEGLMTIPIPKIEGSDEDVDFWLDNIVFQCDEGFPVGSVRFRVLIDQKLELRTEKPEEQKVTDRIAMEPQKEAMTAHGSARMALDLERIRFKVEGLHFGFVRKQIPRLEDEGFADLSLMRGRGGDIKILLGVVSKRQEAGKVPTMHLCVESVQCNFARLGLTITDAKNHELLLKVFTPLLRRLVRDRIERGVESGIRDLISSIQERVDEMSSQAVRSIVSGQIAA